MAHFSPALSYHVTTTYESALHREKLQSAIEADLSGFRRAVSKGNPANFLDSFENTPDWIADREEKRVIVKENKPVGFVVLNGATYSTREIGIWLSPEARGSGLATQAAREIITLVFDKDPLLKEVRANPTKSNKDSIALWKRLGFQSDPHYAITWLAAMEQLTQRAILRYNTGEFVHPLALHLDV